MLCNWLDTQQGIIFSSELRSSTWFMFLCFYNRTLFIVLNCFELFIHFDGNWAFCRKVHINSIKLVFFLHRWKQGEGFKHRVRVPYGHSQLLVLWTLSARPNCIFQPWDEGARIVNLTSLVPESGVIVRDKTQGLGGRTQLWVWRNVIA